MNWFRKSILGQAWRHTFAASVFPTWFLVGCIAAITGPFGTFDQLTPLTRLSFWMALSGLGVFVSQSLYVLLTRGRSDESSFQVEAFRVLAIGIVLPPMIIGLLRSLGSSPADLNMSYWQVLASVQLISALVSTLRFVQRRSEVEMSNLPAADPQSIAADGPEDAGDPAPEEPAPVPEVLSRAPILERLPDTNGTRILHLSARDHFVTVATDQGSHEIRMRFADAVRETQGVEGFLVHRSHWVAQDAIDQPVKERNKVFLQLSNGQKVPVSRTYLPRLQDIGLV